jgi:enoyl-CoA hydratase
MSEKMSDNSKKLVGQPEAGSEHEWPVVISQRFGHVGVITLNDPERRNPLNTSPNGSEQQLLEALLSLEADDEARVVVITGSGPAFCAGADVRSVGGAAYSRDQVIARTLSNTNILEEARTWALWSALERYSKPLIAAVNGFAIGGGWELALWCDVIIADETAQFSLAQINLGYLPVFASIFLTRTAGRYRTAKLALTGEFVSAAQAFEMGAVTEIVGSGESLTRARSIAEEMSARPALVLSSIKRAICRTVSVADEWRSNQHEFVLLGLSDASTAERQAWGAAFRAGHPQASSHPEILAEPG